MTLSTNIETISTALSNIETAIIAKGVTPSGNITTYATAIGSIQTDPTLASLTVTPSTTAQTITPPSGTDGYNTVIASAVTASIDNNITAGNIKKDVSILGVTGTYEGSGGGGISKLSCYRNDSNTGKYIYIVESTFANSGGYYSFRGYSGSNQNARISVTENYFSNFSYDATQKIIYDFSSAFIDSYSAYPSGDISF